MISRHFAGVWGLAKLTALALCALGILWILAMPDWLLVAAALFFAGLFVLQAISVRRGVSGQSQTPGSFTSNQLGQPVSEVFEPAYQDDTPLAPGEKVLALAGPVRRVAAGLRGLFSGGSREVMGRRVVKDGENCLLVTGQRLQFLMLGPEELRRFAPDAKTARLLEALPGDAGAKRALLWQHGQDQVRTALEHLVSTWSLEAMRQRLFAFSIPLAKITRVLDLPRSQSLRLRAGGRDLQYSFRRPADREKILAALAELGLPVAGEG